MAKVLLVEDDNNLREIYEARLQAEGYDIVSARDGEEALVIAKSEKPDLVISDVMMPKISGFEMLDILRNTEGLKEVKVIMLTALGQAEDQSRADSLGADRYLVKSQVTLEDIVNAAQQLLSESGAAPAAPTPVASPEPTLTPVTVAPPPEPTNSYTPPIIPLASAPEPIQVPAEPQMPPTPASTIPAMPVEEPITAVPAPTPVADTAEPQTSEQEEAVVKQQIDTFIESQAGTAPAEVEPEVTTPSTTPEEEQALNDALTDLNGSEAPVSPTVSNDQEVSTHKKVIVPITDVGEPKKSLNDLLAEEDAKENQAAATPLSAPPAPASPAAVATPPAPPQPTVAPNDFDPNSISL